MRNYPGMTAPSYQTVKLRRGRHSSRHAGVRVTKVAPMLAHDPFCDRARFCLPTIGAFLRTYHDGSTTSADRTSTRSLRLTPYERK
jgi:hypothetical protein